MKRLMLSAALLAAVLAALATAPAAFAGGKGCPPGLAKKSPACLPPGQAKKYQDNAYRQPDYRDSDYRLRIGDRIGDRRYHWITYPERYGLAPAGPGWRYAIVDGQILRVNRETLEVLDLIRAVTAILD